MAPKDVRQVYESEISKMINQADNENYTACTKLSTGLIRLSSMVDFEDGIFIAEVLESTFIQLKRLIDTYEVTDIDRAMLKESSLKCLKTLPDNIVSFKIENVYEQLRDFRKQVTVAQFKYYDTAKPKPRKNPFSFEE